MPADHLRPRTVLHVGPHKTGSTALQIAFTRHEAALAGMGVRYARTGRVDAAQFDLVEAARGRAVDLDAAEMAAGLAAEGDAHPVLLISCENVVHLDEGPLSRLRDALPRDRPVTVVYYLRRLVDLWPSHWRELVKHGVEWSFTDYLAHASLARAPVTWRIDQMAQVTRLVDTFGADAITVVGYDALREEGRDIAEHFASAILGLGNSNSPSTLPTAPAVNASEAPWRVELVRYLNRLHADLYQRRATAALRVATLAALDVGEVPFADRFRDLAGERRRPIELTVDGMTAAMQQRTLDVVRPFLSPDPDPVVDAYMRPVTRWVEWFKFPAGEEELQEEIAAFYHALPKAARASVGPRLGRPLDRARDGPAVA